MTCLKWLVVSVAILSAAVLMLAPIVSAQQASPSAKPVAPAIRPVSAAPNDYVIGPEDVLQVSVWKNETLSRGAPVRPDGKISLPLLHDIQAAGLTAMQLRDKISKALGEFMIVVVRKNANGQTECDMFPPRVMRPDGVRGGKRHARLRCVAGTRGDND